MSIDPNTRKKKARSWGQRGAEEGKRAMDHNWIESRGEII